MPCSCLKSLAPSQIKSIQPATPHDPFVHIFDPQPLQYACFSSVSTSLIIISDQIISLSDSCTLRSRSIQEQTYLSGVGCFSRCVSIDLYRFGHSSTSRLPAPSLKCLLLPSFQSPHPPLAHSVQRPTSGFDPSPPLRQTTSKFTPHTGSSTNAA